MKEETDDMLKDEMLNKLENKVESIECHEFFWDDDRKKYFPQYKIGIAHGMWRAYVSAFYAMFTGRGFYGNAKLNYLDWKERIAAIVFNLISFGGLASLIFGIINLSPFLLVVGGVLVSAGLYSAWLGAKIAKESRRIYVRIQTIESRQGKHNWQFVAKDVENITLIPVQSGDKLISDGVDINYILDIGPIFFSSLQKNSEILNDNF